MPITIEKIKEAQEKLIKVQEAASQVNEILVIASNGVLANDEGIETIALTEDQRTALLAEYNARKAALQTAMGDLL